MQRRIIHSYLDENQQQGTGKVPELHLTGCLGDTTGAQVGVHGSTKTIRAVMIHFSIFKAEWCLWMEYLALFVGYVFFFIPLLSYLLSGSVPGFRVKLLYPTTFFFSSSSSPPTSLIYLLVHLLTSTFV